MVRSSDARIPVFDPKGDDILSYVHPARARTLVTNGRAFVKTKEPFTIKLARDPREDKMATQRRVITNFTTYFAEKRDVYVQNVTNTQVSIQFQMSPGIVEGQLLPKSRHPLNLTQIVPFRVIEASMDIRKLVNRNPPALRLLSEGEYMEYYQGLADENGISVDEAIYDAHSYQNALNNKQVFTNPTPDPRRTTLEEEAKEREAAPPDPQEKLTARVIGICNQVGDHIDKDQRLPARDMLDEVKTLNMDDGLTIADLEYLQGKGYHKSVTQWAAKTLGERMGGTSFPLAPPPSQTPPQD
jgi:hypothetical protein